MSLTHHQAATIFAHHNQWLICREHSCDTFTRVLGDECCFDWKPNGTVDVYNWSTEQTQTHIWHDVMMGRY